MTEERIKLEDDDFIFSDYYSDRILICDHDKRLQILQDHEIVNRLRERIKELEEDTHYNNPKFIPISEDSYYPVYVELQKFMEDKK